MYLHDNFKDASRTVANVLVVLALVATCGAASHWSVPPNTLPLQPARSISLAPRAPTVVEGQRGVVGLPRSRAAYRFTAALRVHNGSFSRVMRRAVERVPKGFVGRLTVFKHVSVIVGQSPGPVTVALSSVAEARIAEIANSLPAMAPVMCHEDTLLYVLAFSPKGRHTPFYQFRGWSCGGTVEVSLDGTALPPLEDRSCSLLKVVRSLAPASAVGTRDVAVDCSRKA